MPHVDFAFIDPQRRNLGGSQNRKGLYRLQDCSPNIIALLPALKDKAATIILKTSPMLDIDQGIEELDGVCAVHIVEWQNECKEILYILKPNKKIKDIPITAINLNTGASLTFTREEEAAAKAHITAPQSYLYEPSPAFMKSGSYKTLCTRENVSKIARHTHLYTSDDLRETFPGRAFKICGTFPAQAKALPFKKANLAIRNFPSETAALKKKLKLKDGGEDYLFACTLNDETRTLIHARKIDQI